MFVGDEWKWTVAILFWIAVFLSPFVAIAVVVYKKFFKEKHDKKTKHKLKNLPKTRVAKLQGFYYKHRIITILLIIGSAWAIIWLGQAAVERYNFYRVEKTMDKITQEINAKFSVLSVQKDRSCGTSSEAFGEHLGGCSISYKYNLAVPIGQGKDFSLKIDNLIRERPDVAIWNASNSSSNYDKSFKLAYKIREADPDKYYSTYYLNSIKNPVCEIEYYPSNNTKSTVSIYFSCFLSGSNAKFPYFPIQK